MCLNRITELTINSCEYIFSLMEHVFINTKVHGKYAEQSLKKE